MRLPFPLPLEAMEEEMSCFLRMFEFIIRFLLVFLSLSSVLVGLLAFKLFSLAEVEDLLGLELMLLLRDEAFLRVFILPFSLLLLLLLFRGRRRGFLFFLLGLVFFRFRWWWLDTTSVLVYVYIMSSSSCSALRSSSSLSCLRRLSSQSFLTLSI